MDSSSVCVRKLGLKWWRKTQEMTLKTLLINSPFSWKYLLSNKWRKTPNRVGKTSSKLTLKSWLKQPTKPLFYRARKTSRWGNISALAADGRPARSTTNGHNSDRWSLGQPARSTVAWNRDQSSLPVDRGFPESRSSLVVDRVGRPAL